MNYKIKISERYTEGTFIPNSPGQSILALHGVLKDQNNMVITRDTIFKEIIVTQ